MARQSPIWGDDELLAGLLRISKRAGADQFVHVWNPLLISSLVVDSQTSTWVDLLGRLGSVATVISAFAVDNHWYPLVWGLDSESMKLFTCGVPEAQYAAFQFLNSIVGVHRSGAQQPWKSTPLGFCPTGHRGALALLFVRHLLWGEPLVYMQAQVEAAADSSSVDFGTELSSACHRPRLAALGLDPSGLLGDLLQKHGVGADEVSDRVALIRRELGDDTIAKVVLTGNPWQELKWHANQLRPPLTLIKPSELQKTIDQRADRPVGAKKHKQAKGKGKGKHALSAVLDPTMLRLEGGVFQSQQGQALAQVALTGLAAGVSGVVLTIQAVAKQYLQAGKALSTGGPGISFVGWFSFGSVWFPSCQCACPFVLCGNLREPLLVDACLVQMGAIMVERAPATVEFSVQSVPACVVKAMVYRDLTACN